MLKLVISDDEGKTTVVPLVRDEITIGRKEGNTIRLTERNVSRRHARLRKADGNFTIEDLGSYNGVKVNGQRIAAETRLESGDEVTIGDYVIAMQSETAGATADAGGFAEPTPPARIVMLTPPAPGAEFAMRNGMRIGRAEDLDVWVNHRSISREHAEIRVDGDEIRIVDLGSANGMRVNGDDSKEAVLVSGDVVELGQVRFRFVAEGEHYVFESDRTVQMDAVTLPEPTSSRTTYIAAAAILLIAVIVGAGIALSSNGEETTSTPVIDPDPVADPPEGEGEGEEGATPAAAALQLIADCQTALEEARHDDAVRLADSALEVDPGNADARACQSEAQAVLAEQETFERGQAAMADGDVETAYFAFEELPQDSVLRDRPEVAEAREAFAEHHLMQARETYREQPDEAQRHATAVLTIEGISAAQERAAQQILSRLNAPAPSPRNTMRRAGMRGGSSSPTETEMEAVMAPVAMSSTPVNVRQVQRECSYDNRCIIDRLRGAPQNAQVLGVLVEANRSVGNGPATRRLMQEYLRRYPTGPQAGAYRRQLGQ